MTSWKWYSGPNDEHYTNGPFDTREEAVAALEGDAGHVIEAMKHDVHFTVERLIENQYDENDDLFDYDNAEPGRIGDWKTADAELQALLDGWVDKHRDTFVEPNMFVSTRNDAVIAAQVSA